MKKTMKLALALVAGTMLNGVANAASFTKTYVATAFYETDGAGRRPPYESVTQTFTLRFDPTVNANPVITDYSSDTGGVFANSPDRVNYDFNGDTINFYLLYKDSFDSPSYYLSGFYTDMAGNSASPSIFLYRDDSFGPNGFNASDANITVAAIPESSTWLMMLVGFGLIGATARYRRRGAKVTYA